MTPSLLPRQPRAIVSPHVMPRWISSRRKITGSVKHMALEADHVTYLESGTLLRYIQFWGRRSHILYSFKNHIHVFYFFQLAYKKLRIFSDIQALSLIFHVVYMAQHFAKPNYFVLEKRQPNMFNENMPNILYKINCNNTIQCNCITICLKQYNTNISLNAQETFPDPVHEGQCQSNCRGKLNYG